MSNQAFEQAFLAAFEQRKQMRLPATISNLLNMWEVFISNKKEAEKEFFSATNYVLFGITPQMIRAFKSKSELEQMQYYSFCVDFLQEMNKNPEIIRMSWPQQSPLEPKSMETRVTINKGGFYGWDRSILTVNTEQKFFSFGAEKVNLRNYYVRDSKNTAKKAIVFEAINSISRLPIIKVAFESADFHPCRQLLFRIVYECEKQRLHRQLRKISQGNFVLSTQSAVHLTQPPPLPISSFNLRTFPKFQDPSRTTHGSSILFQNSCKKITTSGHTFYLEQLLMMSKEKVIEGLKLPSEKWNQLVRDSRMTKRPQNNRWEQVTENCFYLEREYVLEFVREDRSNVKEGKLVYHREVHNSRITHPSLTPISFVKGQATALSITQNQCKLYLQLELDTGDIHYSEFAVTYLKSVSNIFQALNFEEHEKLRVKPHRIIKHPYRTNASRAISHHSHADSNNLQQTVYFSVNGYEEEMPVDEHEELKLVIEENSLVDEIKNVSDEGMAGTMSTITRPNGDQNHISYPTIEIHEPPIRGILSAVPSRPRFTVIDPNDIMRCLKVHHELGAGPDKPLKLLQRHFFQDDWVKLKSGAVKCVNEKLMSEHKKVFTHVLKSFGKNILKSKNILDISLPVSIFKTQSHLRSIALNFTYAPLLLDRTTRMDPLERMKWILLFIITVATTSISSDKPFNPHLGQTYQGLINQCPISLEQISHHPPISSYVFSGRGYTATGTIEPKIELGLNCGKGYTERPQKIYYEDGSVIEMSHIKLVLSGIMVGDRVFYFQGKCFCYDSRNMLFAELEAGPKKKGLFGRSSDADDLITGRILRVSQSFESYFRKNNSRAFPNKQHIVGVLSQFEGNWTETIRFDGKPYINIIQQHPCLLEEYPDPLPSNSTYRTDLLKLIKGNLDQAQQEKERLEDVQRHEEKLREKNRKKI